MSDVEKTPPLTEATVTTAGSAAAPPEQGELMPADLQGDWRTRLTLNKSGLPRATLANAITILANDPRWSGVFAYNVRADRPVFLQQPPWDADYGGPDGFVVLTNVTDADAARVVTWLERTWCFSLNLKLAYEAIAVAAHQLEFDPVQQYLEGLTWDGVPRLDFWLNKFLGAQDTPLNRAFGAKWLVAAVARVYEPGCIADNMLTLIGRQGLGKSRALRVLAGAAHFTDELPTLGNKDADIQLQGPWIIELSELEALRRAELPGLKAFISRRVDRFRSPFGRVAADHPRRCVLAGTTNEDSFLRDPTGSRRFWPVECGVERGIDVEGLAAVRDQLWAEAVARFKSGSTWYLDDVELNEAASRRNERFFAGDPWEQVVVEYIERKRPAQLGPADVLADVLQVPAGRWGVAEVTRVGAILKRLGWTKRRLRRAGTKNRAYMYVPPVQAPPGGGTPGGTPEATSSSTPIDPVQVVLANSYSWGIEGGKKEDKLGEVGGPGGPPGPPAAPAAENAAPAAAPTGVGFVPPQRQPDPLRDFHPHSLADLSRYPQPPLETGWVVDEDPDEETA